MICTLISALALGLPYALAIFPLHAMRAAGRGATDAAEPYGRTVGTGLHSGETDHGHWLWQLWVRQLHWLP